MYIQQNTSKNKNGSVYKSTLLCHKYREDGKIKTKVLANLSMLPDEAILALSNSLGKDKEAYFSSNQIAVKNAIDFGFAAILIKTMENLRISELFDKIMPSQSNVIKLLIIGKIITRGSKLAIFNWIKRNQKIAQMLNVDLHTIKLDEIYQYLGQMPEYQQQINRKWALYNKQHCNEIFLYDITSSYFHGNQNVLSDYGYNRDGVKGKKQINIGLITDETGFPLKIQVFEGNVNDHKTVVEQLQTLKSDFKAESIVFIGDRGMKIRYNLEKMTELQRSGIDYITGLTKDEIKGLLANKTIQLDLFSEELAEVQDGDLRYVLSVNSELTKDSKIFRNKMREKFEDAISIIQASYNKKQNQFSQNKIKLQNGNKNKNLVTQFTVKQIDMYKRRTEEVLKKYFMKTFYEVKIDAEKFETIFNLEKYNNERSLDGCYVVVSNIGRERMDMKAIRKHYKGLQHVEHAFRDMKTCGLDIRPIFHVNEATTRGHVLVTMFSYAIIHELESKIFPFLKSWNKENKQQYAYQDIQDELQNIKLVELNLGKNCQKILLTDLTPIQEKILETLKIKKSELMEKICSN
jgi:transposase